MEGIGVIEALSGWGIGAVLAATVLIWKRSDDKMYQRKLEEITAKEMANNEKAIVAQGELAEALTKLTEIIQGYPALAEIQARIRTIEEKLGASQ